MNNYKRNITFIVLAYAFANLFALVLPELFPAAPVFDHSLFGLHIHLGGWSFKDIETILKALAPLGALFGTYALLTRNFWVFAGHAGALVIVVPLLNAHINHEIQSYVLTHLGQLQHLAHFIH